MNRSLVQPRHDPSKRKHLSVICAVPEVKQSCYVFKEIISLPTFVQSCVLHQRLGLRHLIGYPVANLQYEKRRTLQAQALAKLQSRKWQVVDGKP